MDQRKNSEQSFGVTARKKIKNAAQNFFLLFIVCCFLFGILEIFLRIYKPFQFRVKGDKIILPANKKYIIKNNGIEKLDKIIIHTKNNLGFRGEEAPENFKNYLTIITIGGSATECFQISDGKTWPDVLGKKLKNNFTRLWINNAGLDGQSTFGHIVLMEDYVVKLKPKIVIFLVGLNDEGEETYNKYDELMIKPKFNPQSIKKLLSFMTNNSEVFGLALNIVRNIKARNMGLVHRGVDLRKLKHIEIPEKTKEKIRQIQNKMNHKPFEIRLKKLIRLARENGIDPIFITQPTLYGNTIDDITNVNLATLEGAGELRWEGLERVNDVTRRVGEEEKVFVIDLSRELPKSSKYYYDFVHYTNEGNEKVAGIIFKNLCPYLTNKYKDYLTKDCVIQ